MVLQLNPALRSRLQRWAEEGYPDERCGLLIGRDRDGVVRVEDVLPARNLNTQRKRDRYELDPQDLLRADAQARERQLDIVGIWHTHPDHPARPSETDRAQAWNAWSYLIVSVGAAGVQSMRSWRLDGRDFTEEVVRT
jgi:proteasome lid subunit RPN8/RPN11